MDTHPVEWVIAGVFLLIGAIFTLFMVNEQKRHIRETLKRKGTTPLDISWNPFDFDKSNHSYDVSYQDSEGKIHQTSCKIHMLGFTIYWAEED